MPRTHRFKPEEGIPSEERTISGASTSVTAFIGSFKRGPMGKVERITSFAGFERVFGGLAPRSEAAYAVQQFYLNGGDVAWVVRVAGGDRPNSDDLIDGMKELETIAPDIFNILCLPAAANLKPRGLAKVVSSATAFCEDQRAFLIVDIPKAVRSYHDMTAWMTDNDTLRHRNAAVYYPRLEIPDALNRDQPRNVGASGTLAGVYARMDSAHGVWKTPAGPEAALKGANIPKKERLTDEQTDELNRIGVNTLRTLPSYGNVSWGARTMVGSDQVASDWKYIPVRRTALYIEESLYQGLKWAVFEPNDAPLWEQIRLTVGAFMDTLFRQGAFQGITSREAYFIKCGRETTTQNDIDNGIVNVVVGFAPLKPAEFVIIKIQQIAGQIQA